MLHINIYDGRVDFMNKDTTQIFMTELDTYLFGQGTHYEIYNKMGAHPCCKERQGGGDILLYGHQRQKKSML